VKEVAMLSKKKFTAIAILVWFICILLFGDVSRSDMYVFTNRIPVFLIGVLFGWMERNEKVELNKYHYGVCIIALMIGLYLEKIAVYSYSWKTLHIFGTGIPALLVTVPLVLLLPQLFDLLTTYLRKVGQSIIKLFSLVGGVSFEIYCVQEWIGNKVQSILCDSACSNLEINIADNLTVCIACITLVLASKFITNLLSKRNQK
jgi:peptidoglycan/LPS O-acetylase OafA/YrhL